MRGSSFGKSLFFVNFALLNSSVYIMNWSGIVLGVSAFLLIGVFHPIVVKTEYYFGKGCWWVFAIIGVAFCVASILVQDVISAAVLGVTGFSCFWSIFELFEQEKRVKRGWFPRNPKRQ